MSNTTGKARRKASDFIPILADSGIDWVPGLVLGSSVSSSQPLTMMVTQLTATTTTLAVDFMTEFGKIFQDTNYMVCATSNLSTGPIGWTSKAAGSITLNGTENNEVITLILIGKLEGQP